MFKIYLIIFSLFLITDISASSIRQEAEQKISLVFNSADSQLVFSKFSINKAIKKKVENSTRQRFFKSFVYTWKIFENDSLAGIAILDNVYGKSMPITFLVMFDPDGKIISSEVIKYREQIGGNVSAKSWLNQFNGKDKAAGYAPGTDIDTITGATISVNAMAKGIKKLALLFPYIHNK